MLGNFIEVLNLYEAVNVSVFNEKFIFESIKYNIDFSCYWMRYGRYIFGKEFEKVLRES